MNRYHLLSKKNVDAAFPVSPVSICRLIRPIGRAERRCETEASVENGWDSRSRPTIKPTLSERGGKCWVKERLPIKHVNSVSYKKK